MDKIKELAKKLSSDEFNCEAVYHERISKNINKEHYYIEVNGLTLFSFNIEIKSFGYYNLYIGDNEYSCIQENKVLDLIKLKYLEDLSYVLKEGIK